MRQRREHRRVMRCSGNHGEGDCCLSLDINSNREETERNQAELARKTSREHGTRVKGNFRENFRGQGVQHVHSTPARLPAPHGTLGALAALREDGVRGPPGFLAITDPGCPVCLESDSCESAPAGSQLLSLLPVAPDLVARSLSLAQGMCFTWGLGAPCWAWSFSCIPFSNLSPSTL